MSAENPVRKSLFAVYDLMIKRWATSILSKVTNEGLIVMASPMRAFSEASLVIKNSQPKDQTVNYQAEKIANIPLPLVSMQRGGISTREFGRSPRLNLFQTGFTDPSGRWIKTSLPPTPIWIEYTLDIWCKTQVMMSQVVSAFVGDFDPYLTYAKVDFGSPFGKYMAPIRMNSMSDISELEGGEMGDRTLRYNLQLRVEAWKFHENDFELSNLDTIAEIRTTTLLSDPIILDRPKYKKIFIQTVQGTWMELISLRKGSIGVVPSEIIPEGNELTYLKCDQIVLSGGVIIEDKSGIDFLHQFNPTPVKFNRYQSISATHHPSPTLTSKPLVIMNTQTAYLGGKDPKMFGKLKVQFVDLEITPQFMVI